MAYLLKENRFLSCWIAVLCSFGMIFSRNLRAAVGMDCSDDLRPPMLATAFVKPSQILLNKKLRTAKHAETKAQFFLELQKTYQTDPETHPSITFLTLMMIFEIVGHNISYSGAESNQIEESTDPFSDIYNEPELVQAMTAFLSVIFDTKNKEVRTGYELFFSEFPAGVSLDEEIKRDWESKFAPPVPVAEKLEGSKSSFKRLKSLQTLTITKAKEDSTLVNLYENSVSQLQDALKDHKKRPGLRALVTTNDDEYQLLQIILFGDLFKTIADKFYSYILDIMKRDKNYNKLSEDVELAHIAKQTWETYPNNIFATFVKKVMKFQSSRGRTI